MRFGQVVRFRRVLNFLDGCAANGQCCAADVAASLRVASLRRDLSRPDRFAGHHGSRSLAMQASMECLCPKTRSTLMDVDPKCYEQIIETLHDGLYFVDPHRRIVYWNHAAELISGFTADEVVGARCSDNILTHVDAAGNSLCLGKCPLAATMNDCTARETEIYMHHKDGHRVPVSVRTSPLIDVDGNVIGGIELFSDISSQDANALRVEELERLSMLDSLTRLANRYSLEREIEARIEERRRYRVPFGVLLIDIDHFKQFNDTHGHDLGDKVLAFVAKTMVAASRPFDVYGRWGGEEFVGIVRNATPEEHVHVGERLRTLIATSYLMHGDERINVTVSMGGTLVREDDTVESLIKRADSLMYESKVAGRNQMTVDSPAAELLLELHGGS
jgi:diguanylate cyclase (GGDEF)-like protein/PAS domain S-box-containing protein